MARLVVRHKNGGAVVRSESGAGSSKLLAVLVAIILVAILAGGIGFSLSSRDKAADSDKSINTNEYQALFLTNGQVYFGKLSDLDDKYITISDIYYLQVQQSSSDTQQSVQPAGSGSTSSSQVSLAKLGSELHGPEDKMNVSSQQVLFWENLKNDSKVVQAIKKYQNK